MTPARWLAVVFFLAYAAAVTWPGAVPFNRIRPLVLGMPLSMVWVALWLVLAFGVLLILDRSETRAEDRRGNGPPGSDAPRSRDDPRRSGGPEGPGAAGRPAPRPGDPDPSAGG